MTLYGRAGLLADLTSRLDRVSSDGRGQLLAVQGRRQVGKSTLLTRFTETCAAPYLYTTAIKNGPTHTQLGSLSVAAQQSRTPLPQADLTFGSAPSSWTEAFTRIALAAQQGPVVVVIDEFPWAVEQSRTLEGELQVAWDSRLEHLPVLMILVGSDVAMMDRLMDHDRPLFGRTQTLVVPPLNPREVADALPSAHGVDAFDAYLVTGGYPRLVRSCAAAGSARRYVRAALRDDGSDLVVTARRSLDAEFADAAGAYRVLSAIGGNAVANPGFLDVVSALSDPDDREAARTATTRALATLTSAKRMIQVTVPAGAPPTSKLRRYQIVDPYLRFWFTFVERQVDNIARGRADLAVAQFDRSWSSWRGQSVEPVVRDALLRLFAHDDGELRAIETVGAWWNRDNSVEVDLVARDRRRAVALGTIKWRDRAAVTAAEVSALRQGRGVVPDADNATLIGVCPAGARDNTGLDRVVSADDLITAWHH